jgi:hypothetical protein
MWTSTNGLVVSTGALARKTNSLKKTETEDMMIITIMMGAKVEAVQGNKSRRNLFKKSVIPLDSCLLHF